ncbi:MAG: PSD1 and planctomycete cytochrome C domain-containing protein [Armatimonadetes bacterium]|nr:PSD1 and planctomycete cytochrome C domain-containing protein [Armatimonadota bacterium]
MRVLFPLFTAVALLMVGRAEAQAPDYTKEVRPILSQHCFKCHGPDEKQRQAGLRLDNYKSASALLATSHRALIARKPQQSELVKRIFTSGSSIMPPLTANKPLSDAQKRILQRWIAAGAEYKPHWAFIAPKQVALPTVKQTKWVRNPIDNFILSSLEKTGLTPSPSADKATLLRRVSLDLIGLPPTPEDTEAFLKDKRPDAYERLVDRLLASPHYGERWARRWLDLARYADTNGYEKDRTRPIWLYRDWVINALNRDMPFNKFTIEQLAGDMLPNATLDQKIATGLHRNTMLNEEGGIDPLEYRFYAMTDRLATTGTTWLGLTTGCAQCHSHKFDPITQKEYYQMMAFLNNADEPEMEVLRPELMVKRQEIQGQIDLRTINLKQKFPAKASLNAVDNLYLKLTEWLGQVESKAVHWTTLKPSKATSNSPLLTVQPDNSVLSSGDITKQDTYTLTYPTGGRAITAVRLECLPDDSLPKGGPGRVFYEGSFGDFLLSELTLLNGGTPVKFSTAYTDNGGNPKQAIDDSPQSFWSSNGVRGKAVTAVFVLDKPLSTDVFTLKMLFEFYYPSALGRFRISITSDSKISDTVLPAEVDEMLVIPADQRTVPQRTVLLNYYLSIAPELAKEREEIKKLRDQLPEIPSTLVFKERPSNNTRPTYIHKRGEFLQPTERVEPSTLAVLNPFPTGIPRNRLTFAQWIVSPQNPLVGRVAVNRQWAALFGKGIVTTLDDFGYQGQLPSHPELLDWLAIEFEKKNWSLKQLHRLILTSATYRQTAVVPSSAKAKDPVNRLLSYFPRTRMEAELIRDNALTVCGLLSRKMGGPSVFPPQKPSITTEGTFGALQWTVSSGEDRYRRGLYTFSKRTAPYAIFTTFDAPSGEACVARREVSNTPLQALTLLNNEVFLEAAQTLGKSMLLQKGTLEERITALFRRCLTRNPDNDELRLLKVYFETQKQRFDNKELDAKLIAGVGEGDLNERAAWTALSRALLNLDEFVTKQ